MCADHHIGGATHIFLFGITRTTELLGEYSKAEWVKHPSVSAAMVLVSLQKDGKGKNAVAGTVAEHSTKLSELTTRTAAIKASCKGVHDELRALKTKNPKMEHVTGSTHAHGEELSPWATHVFHKHFRCIDLFRCTYGTSS